MVGDKSVELDDPALQIVNLCRVVCCCRTGCAGGELHLGMDLLQPRAGHVQDGAAAAGSAGAEHGPVHARLPGAPACHAAGAVCL